jgi:hypothetical protein
MDTTLAAFQGGRGQMSFGKSWFGEIVYKSLYHKQQQHNGKA